MASMIDRYIHDVTRRLPEKDREDVSRELLSHLEDMLPPDADGIAIEAVLLQMGSPAALAEQYRQHPRYLISPALYDDYIHTVRWLAPLIAVILFVVSLAVSGITALKGDPAATPSDLSPLLSAFVTGISAFFQIVFWITVGFAIADKLRQKRRASAQDWSLSDLPDDIPHPKNEISLSDSIAELIIIAAISLFGSLWCALSAPLSLRGHLLSIVPVFHADFLAACLPVLVLLGVLGISMGIVKVSIRRWTPMTCTLTVLYNLSLVASLLYLFLRQSVFSPELATLLASGRLGGHDVSHLAEGGLGNPIIALFVGLIAIGSLAECGTAFFRTSFRTFFRTFSHAPHAQKRNPPPV